MFKLAMDEKISGRSCVVVIPLLVLFVFSYKYAFRNVLTTCVHTVKD